MYIQDDGIRLNAKLELPEPAVGKCPLVILTHGITGHIEERHIIALASAIWQTGCAVLRVDLYGHGHSDGDFQAHTLYKWVNNLITVIDYAGSLGSFSRLYLCGHSQGGLAVMLTAALERDRIDGLIPLSPAWRIPEDARRGVLLGHNFDPDRIPDRLLLKDGFILDGNYLRVAQSVRAEDAIDRYHGPVLIVHGDADHSIPISDSETAAARYHDCRFVRIPEDTHCYDRHLDLVTKAVTDWLNVQFQT